MPRVLQRIRQCILNRMYYLSSHCEEEMIEDGMERQDLEHALLNGVLTKRYTHDPRGTRYQITGPAIDGRPIEVVCRFEEHELILITTWATERVNKEI